MKNLLAGASLIALLASAGSPHAAEAAAEAPAPAAGSAANEVEEVIVTGTRETGVKAADSAAPIQLVGKQQLLRTGAPDLATSLTAAVPSLNIQTNGGDAAAVHILAALRGLSPDDTLVLVDGKRRHPTSNLAVDSGSVFSGSATTDLNYIPVGAIDHIEVLTDGAAAQYGTDAIAGVVNIILKKSDSGGVFTATGGQDYNGQGATGAVSYTQAFKILDKGFLDVTLEERYHDFTTLGYGDLRCQSATGALINNGCPPSVTQSGVTYPVTHATNWPHENRVNGDPEYNIYNAFFNGGYNITDNVQFYTFGNYSYNASQHFENYRVSTKVAGPSSTGTEVYAFPLGFDPKEKFDERDYSVTGGFRGEFMGWNWDLSSTYGGNHTEVYVLDTANAAEFATLQKASATPINYPLHTIYDGNFDATEWTNTLDIDRSFKIGLAAPLNVAFGFEERRDTYGIGSGSPESFYGSGAQSFFGYAPTDAGNYSRVNYAAYFDLATDPIKHLHVDIAGRYEHYSDFGSTEDGKVTLRYDFTPTFAVRGTISNGFRAPTLAEEYYSGVNVGPTSASGQLPPDSAAAVSAGFSPLKPELSINYSVGFVAHPLPDLQITLDAYEILLHNRILVSPSFVGAGAYCVPNAQLASTPTTGLTVNKSCSGVAGTTAEDVIVSQNVLNALSGRGVSVDGLTSVGIATFYNAVSTRTDGIEATINYATDFQDFGHVDWSVGFNYNKTQITKVNSIPAAVTNANPAYDQMSANALTYESASALTTATPREKVILQGYWTWHKFSVNLRETIYGSESEYISNSPPILAKIGATGITDLDIGYKITRALKIDVGANNLFNIIPPITPLNASNQPESGALVYGLPYGFAPWGQNGGYYYGRITLNF
jgi:iron complex outermembrane receptor protein